MIIKLKRVLTLVKKFWTALKYGGWNYAIKKAKNYVELDITRFRSRTLTKTQEIQRPPIYPTKVSEASDVVDIININFYDWNGEILYKGGAERYVYDLACLLKENGWRPRILQNANKPFTKEFKGFPVWGIPLADTQKFEVMSEKYREICAGSHFVIASPLDLACKLGGLRVIGINHGIYWDGPKAMVKPLEEYKHLFDAVRAAQVVVAVDTNFINWLRTYDYQLALKAVYIPNYFDESRFFPVNKDFSGKIRILYPRRLYEPRGIFITLEAFKILLEKYPDIELHLVGQANETDTKIVSQFVKEHAPRVMWEEFDMEDMDKVYRLSHIVLIPTLYAEGTSLSCLEAMATNNAIIATHVGGLPNLVINGYNGILISPTAQSLITAVETLLNDRQQMANMANNGVLLSTAFKKQRWQQQWQNIIEQVAKA